MRSGGCSWRTFGEHKYEEESQNGSSQVETERHF